MSGRRTHQRTIPQINWEGRAVAREIVSGIAVQETKERLEHFLESKKVASLNLGDHRTGALREVEAANVNRILGPRDWQKRRMPHKLLHNAFMRQSPQHRLCLKSPVSFTPGFSPVVDAC